MLDVTGCAHLFGGEAGLRARVSACMQEFGLGVRASIAGTPDAARALVRFGETRVAPAGQDAVSTRALPAAALGLGTDTARALSRAGLRTIGDLADRAPAALAARFGTGLTQRLHRTLGHEDTRIVSPRRAAAVSSERRFAEPLAHMAGVEGVLDLLIADVARQLEAQGAGGRVFEAGFLRSDGTIYRITVETGRPVRSPATLRRLYRERFETLDDPIDPGFGFDAIRLVVLVVETLDMTQPDLEAGPATASLPLADLLDRLSTRFGRDRVLRFAACDTHRPERQAHTVPAQDSAPALPWARPEMGEPPARPLHLFDPPQPIEALAEVPDGPPLRFRWRRCLHDVARAEGPERIAPEWWRTPHGTPSRDYYRIEDSAGRRFWVFREGGYGSGQAPCWFLHGLFA